MPKSKKSALRGPKLFGKIGPRIHGSTRTEWGLSSGKPSVALAYIQKQGRTWEFWWPRDDGTAFSTPGSAKRALEKSIKADRELSKRLGCP